MMRWTSYLLLICFAFTSSLIRAQEELVDLKQVKGMPEEKTSGNTENSRINLVKYPFIYVHDTLPLPFFDDFSTNRIKIYDAEKTDPNVSLKINYDFSVNGNNPDTLYYRSDTTYSILKTIGGDIISQSNTTLFITFYQDGKVIGYDTGWTNVVTQFDQGTALVTFDTLLPDFTINNTPDTFYRVADDATLWTPPIDTFDSARAVPFINNRFAKTPLTQGVATFDGTDDRGMPYDISSETSYGLADVLTSKPIYLDSNMENVYLSFFYQAGGYGNYPDEEDSLVVEFFDVLDSTWRFAYKLRPPVVEDSNWTDQIFLQIDGPRYLRPGFRFRFKNYSTLSGSFDHWHLDYIRMDQDRDTTADDSLIQDVAFVQGMQTLFKDYMSVPYLHYIQDPEAFDAQEGSFTLVNLGLEEVAVIGLNYQVFDPNGNLIGGAVTAEPSVPASTRLTSEFPISDSPIYPDLGTDFADFMIRSSYTSISEQNPYYINDTIYNRQGLRDYYAYDDGTAEKAYGLTGAGLELAYGFNTPIGDSLHAVYFNFPQIIHNDNEDLPIRVLVWDNLEADPIYEAEQWVDPQYTDANDFFRLELDDAVYVQGEFYVGFRQQEAKKVYIGFDANRSAREHTYYRIGQDWYQSSLNGALMIRPSFNEVKLAGVSSPRAVMEANFTVYPNPARDQVQIQTSSKWNSFLLIDISGRLIQSHNGSSRTISMTGLQQGVYFIRGQAENGEMVTTKLVVQP